MAERELLVRILGDDRDLQRALNNTEKRVTAVDTRMASFGRSAGRAFKAAGITIAISESVRVANQMVDAASDLEEQMARTEQVFDDSADSVKSWSAGLASSFGIAQSAGLEFAGTFGLLFRNTGSTAKQAEEFSKQLVELAADLASFNNTDVDTALNALRSGLTGEIEPLRKFGVFLSEARTQQEALASSSGKTSDELTTQDKVLARMNIIMADTVRAQGDFARTSEGLANKQRTAAAEAKNLSANLGQVLAPAMDIALISTIALTGGLNDLIGGMKNLRASLRDSSMFDGFNSAVEEANDRATGFFENLRDGIPLLNRVARLREAVISRADSDIPGAIPGDVSRRRDMAAEATKAAQEAEKDAKRLSAAQARQEKAFNEFIKGSGLKLDRAGLTASLDDDLSALRELEKAILRRIQTEGKTFKLVQLLTDTRLQISSVVEQQAAAAADAAEGVAQAAEDAMQAGQDAFESTLDALDLKLEIAQTTRSFADDQKVLRAIEQAILDRIKIEGRTTDLLRQLFNVRQQQEEVARQVREQQARARKEGQFKALGLTAEGDERTPGSGSLLKRARSLQDQIKGTILDTAKNRQILANVVKLLSTQFKKVGKDVRNAIDSMLDEIAGGFENAEKKVGGGGTGEITKGGIRSTQRLLRGLDLTDEERKIIQQRNLGVTGRRGFSAFGMGLVPSTGTAGSIDRGLQQTETFIIQNLNVVSNDPNDMMKKLQKKARRSSGGRRGRHGGANLGMQ